MIKIRKYAKAIIATLLLTLVTMVVTPAIVLAIADPDSPPSVNAVYVYELNDGSLGVLIDYYLDYAVLPTVADPNDTATNAYIASFVDTDGVTQITTVAPYSFTDSGYGRGLIWIRLTEAEVTAYSLDSANIADYEIWLMGNPTVASGWTGDPPKTIAGIDQWNTTGDMEVLLALRVLYYADLLELIWSLDLVQETAVGSRLTSLGESYFMNVIQDLMTYAPAVFSATELDPDYTPISYDTAFGAIASNGTATVVGSPVTLTEGTNTIDTGATTGTIILTLAGWTSGNVTDDTGIVTGSPVTVYPGTNTLTVTANGTFTVLLELLDTVSLLDTSVNGTALDLTDLATLFGMTRWAFSGLVWMLITIVICAGVYRSETRGAGLGSSVGGSRVVVLVFTVCVIGGSLLGLLHMLVSALLFIGCGALIGYVFFFRSDAIHKGFMFMIWMFIIVSMAGNILAGSVGFVATRLTDNVTANETGTILVASTEGFPASGIIVIGDETIGYPTTTNVTFEETTALGVTTNPLTRGVEGTTAVAHSVGDGVRTKEAGILNAAIDYKIARIVDSAGVLGFLTLPAKLLDLVMTFFVLPLDFLGTDLAILSYIWMVVAIGMVIGFVTSILGGRRV